MQTNDDREIGRAKNAVLELFNERLYIPKIYLDALWEGQRLDVLAIDRDGIGDVHLVLLLKVPAFHSPAQLTSLLQPALTRITMLNAQYKYIGLVEPSGVTSTPGVPAESVDQALAPDGLGRVGFLSVSVPYGDGATARYLLKPERFRARVTALADEYVRQHTADWELRDSPAA